MTTCGPHYDDPHLRSPTDELDRPPRRQTAPERPGRDAVVGPELVGSGPPRAPPDDDRAPRRAEEHRLDLRHPQRRGLRNLPAAPVRRHAPRPGRAALPDAVAVRP